MRNALCFIALLSLAIFNHQLGAEEVSSNKYVGNWLLVNGVLVLHIAEDGTMTLRNTGAKGKITIKDDGSFAWALASKPTEGRIWEDRLLLRNEQEDRPKWMESLEFRRADEKIAAEMLEFALRQASLRQHASTPGASSAARRESIERAIVSNLRQLAIAADRYYLEQKSDTVAFDQIVGPGKAIPFLQPVDGEDYTKLDLRKGAAPWELTTATGLKIKFSR